MKKRVSLWWRVPYHLSLVLIILSVVALMSGMFELMLGFEGLGATKFRMIGGLGGGLLFTIVRFATYGPVHHKKTWTRLGSY